MIQKYRYGTPFETEAVVVNLPEAEGKPAFGAIDLERNAVRQNGEGTRLQTSFCFSYTMADKDIVYGLGEANRGINKRGYIYASNNSDIPHHHEDILSLYGSHNFLIVDGEELFGLFIDYPSTLTFDIGYTRQDRLTIRCDRAELDLYVITGTSAYDIVKQFRKLIGKSYIPPKFAFGYGQSRWGYKTAEDFREVVRRYREAHVPMDMLYMDIDYMEAYKDFTVNKEEFPDFAAFVAQMREQGIHLVPIIDAGVKIEPGYDVYEEGKEKGYFCKRADGSDFEAAVWPGLTHFPDMLNKEAREWFGAKYERLLAAGIDGFWNDMNEPAIFYTPEGFEELRQLYKEKFAEGREVPVFDLQGAAGALSNSPADYRRMYHQVDGKLVCHADVHNLFGYNMTRAAGEAFEKLVPDKRILLFSRSSYIGMHRYGGIWTGDNKSWWSHLLLNIKMLPSLNMCGFLYTGADLGGFGCNTTRDLLLRWLALGVFTPLMRNHSALGTREQEVYRFEGTEDFRSIINVRYRLVPYLYSTFMKAALNDECMFRPLAFDFPKDRRVRTVEDQILLGEEVMIAPVYTQNAEGRYVYLPEEMIFVKFLPDGNISQEVLAAGDHYVEIALNEVPLFIRKDKRIPLVEPAETVDALDMSTVTRLGYGEENGTADCSAWAWGEETFAAGDYFEKFFED